MNYYYRRGSSAPSIAVSSPGPFIGYSVNSEKPFFCGLLTMYRVKKSNGLLGKMHWNKVKEVRRETV